MHCLPLSLFTCLAIAGIPPFSGFFSKDEILAACFEFNPVMGWIMAVIAGMTAFYMFRLYYGIFWGKENKELHGNRVNNVYFKLYKRPAIIMNE